jgi:hypothetical protein
MKTNVGLWIDHRKATIVTVGAAGEELVLVVSKAEKQLRRNGDSKYRGRYESQSGAADDSRQRALTGHQNIYYEAVITCLRDAKSILIFGPGEAKGELKKRMARGKLDGRIAGVETTDKMTDREVASKVRRFFAK